MSRIANWIKQLHAGQLAILLICCVVVFVGASVAAMVFAESRSSRVREASKSSDYSVYDLNREASLSDPELYERKRDIGFSHEQATLYVWNRPKNDWTDIRTPGEADRIGIPAITSVDSTLGASMLRTAGRFAILASISGIMALAALVLAPTLIWIWLNGKKVRASATLSDDTKAVGAGSTV
jgi:hypothetical protein